MDNFVLWSLTNINQVTTGKKGVSLSEEGGGSGEVKEENDIYHCGQTKQEQRGYGNGWFFYLDHWNYKHNKKKCQVESEREIELEVDNIN